MQDRLDLTANTRIAAPLLVDLKAWRMVWCDLALRSTAGLHNNVETSRGGIRLALRSMLHVNKPNLYDLFRLHVRARGEWVESPEGADMVFSPEAGTPFRGEEIAAQYLQ